VWRGTGEELWKFDVLVAVKTGIKLKAWKMNPILRLEVPHGQHATLGKKPAGPMGPSYGTVVVVDEALLAHALVKTGRDSTAAAAVDLTMRYGERVALLGPNGAGKTTTLLTPLGAVTPDARTNRSAATGFDLQPQGTQVQGPPAWRPPPVS
jgi:hypothetical protein